jgi:hypothetical protein
MQRITAAVRKFPRVVAPVVREHDEDVEETA